MEQALQVRDSRLKFSRKNLENEEQEDGMTIEEICFESMLKFIKTRNYEQLAMYLKIIDEALILALPTMFDGMDDGKNLVHICTRLKTCLIMEEMIEKYREVSIKQ